MTQNVPSLTWLGTVGAKDPTAAVACNFDLDGTWNVSFLSSYVGTPVLIGGVTIDNSANGSSVSFTIGTESFTIPGNFIQDFAIRPGSLGGTFKCSGGTTNLKFWITNPTANFQGAAASASSVPATPIIPNSDFSVSQYLDSGVTGAAAPNPAFTNADAKFLVDGWFLSPNGGGNVGLGPSRASAGSFYQVTFSYSAAAALFGCHLDTIANNSYFGKPITFSVDLASNVASSNIWAALAYTTVDAVTGVYRTPVVAPAGGLGGIKINQNWLIASMQQPGLVSTSARFSFGMTLPASFKNAAIIIFTADNTIQWTVARPQIDLGNTALAYRGANYSVEYARAQKQLILKGGILTGSYGIAAQARSANPGIWDFSIPGISMPYAPSFITGSAFAIGSQNVASASQSYNGMSGAFTMDSLTTGNIAFHGTTVTVSPWPPPGSGYTLQNASAVAGNYFGFDARY